MIRFETSPRYEAAPPPAMSLRRKIALGFVVWTVMGLFWTSRLYVSYNSHNFAEPVIPFWTTLFWGLSDWYILGLMSPIAMWLSRKLPLTGAYTLKSIAGHVPLSIVFAGIHLFIFSIVYMIAGSQSYMTTYENPGIKEVYWGMIVGKFHASVIVYWSVVFITNAWDYYRRFREERVRSLEAEAKLSQAELQALRMQLHPHFLFNTLNTISALMRSDVEKADNMLVELSGLLRTSLRQSATLEAPLSAELSFIRKYLDIEKARFGDRLNIEYNIDPEAEHALAPTFILQPLVENAVRHGIAPLEKGGTITISASVNSENLHLSVADNGLGMANPPSDAGEGVGLANTRERLKQLYGDRQSLVVKDLSPGARFEITIPLKSQSTFTTRSQFSK